jgi:hypothetical protein
MQGKYFVYIHENDRYDLHLFNDVLRSLSTYFLIDFDAAADFFLFLDTIPDNHFPSYIIIDLYDFEQVHLLVDEICRLKLLPVLNILILWETTVLPFPNKSIQFASRPQNRNGWEELTHQII